MNAIKRSPSYYKQLAGTAEVNYATCNIILCAEAVDFFSSRDQKARQLAGRNIGIPVDLFAYEFLYILRSPSEGGTELSHARLRDAIGKKDDAIFALKGIGRRGGMG